ncbi:MAG: DUF2283 domain-containing protein [Thermomicrobiales bacterium]
MSSPTVTYDREADALYIRFSTHPIEDTVALSDSVYIDVDADGEAVGFEVLYVSTSDLDALPTLPANADLRDLLKPRAA